MLYANSSKAKAKNKIRRLTMLIVEDLQAKKALVDLKVETNQCSNLESTENTIAHTHTTVQTHRQQY